MGCKRCESAPSQLLRRDLGLVESLRLDEVANGLRLREVDAAVQEGPHGELARLG